MPDWFEWSAKRFTGLRRLPARVRPHLVEMMLYLLAARLLLRLVPFRRLTWFFERPPKCPRDTCSERQWIGALARIPYVVGTDEIGSLERERLIKRARWLTNAATWFLPGQTACMPRAIAAQAFLRRLGIGTTLYYGAATLPARGLTAHVWVQDGRDIVVGRISGHEYHVLARYPETPG